MTASLYQRFSPCIANPCFSCCAFVSMMKSAQRTHAVPFGFCFPPVPRHRAERALHDARVPPQQEGLFSSWENNLAGGSRGCAAVSDYICLAPREHPVRCCSTTRPAGPPPRGGSRTRRL